MRGDSFAARTKAASITGRRAVRASSRSSPSRHVAPVAPASSRTGLWRNAPEGLGMGHDLGQFPVELWRNRAWK